MSVCDAPATSDTRQRSNVASRNRVESLLRIGTGMVFCLSLLPVFSGCKLLNLMTVSVTGITVSPNSMKVVVGQTAQLTDFIQPSAATNTKVTWSSSDTKIATVSSSGLVKGVAVGSATITVTTADGSKKAKSNVTVNAPPTLPTGISLNQQSATLVAGSNTTLKATLQPSGAIGTVDWSSSNTSVATVSSSTGSSITVTAGSTAGTATITATVQGTKLSVDCAVTVTAAPVALTGVSVSPTTISVTAGSTQTLTASLTPSNASGVTVSWASDNTSVATVGPATGSSTTVTAVASGTAHITATATSGGSSYTATATVNVSAAPVVLTGVSVSPTTVSVAAGSTQTLTASLTPSNATGVTVSWSSSKTSIATVTGSGSPATLTGVAAGNTTVTVTATQGSTTFQKQVSVTVTAPVATGITLNNSSASLVAGGSTTLSATLAPPGASGTISWSSDDTAVVTVSPATGSSTTVTAVASGTAHVTATVTSGGTSHTATATVTVLPKLTSVSLNATSSTIVAGGSTSVAATLSPTSATGVTLSWSSSNTAVATVSGSGTSVTVNGVAGGMATITATATQAGGPTVTNQLSITVVGISVSPASATVVNGGTTGTLTATLTPSGVAGVSVLWSSSNTSLVTVNPSGNTATATAATSGSGTATVTATATVGGGAVSSSSTITVTSPLTGITVSQPSAYLSEGATQTLTASLTPSSAGGVTVTWSSNNTSVASVSGSGTTATVTAGSIAGTATITASASQLGATAVTSSVTVQVLAPGTWVTQTFYSNTATEGFPYVAVNGSGDVLGSSNSTAIDSFAQGTLPVTQIANTYTLPLPAGASVGYSQGIAVDPTNPSNFYVADSYNGTVSYFSGGTGTIIASGLSSPKGITTDSSGNVYVACSGTSGSSNGKIIKITVTSGPTYTTSTVASSLNYPTGVAVDSSGTLYVVEQGNQTIDEISGGLKNVLAGTAGTTGSTNDVGTNAKFNYPTDITLDNKGNLYVTDSSNYTVRKIVISSKTVTTIAGTAGVPAGTSGPADGVGAVATFDFPSGITYDASSGKLYVGDPSAKEIRVLTQY